MATAATKHPARTGAFPLRSKYFGDKAAAHQAIADSEGYLTHPEARAAELNEAAIYSRLAADAAVKEASHG